MADSTKFPKYRVDSNMIFYNNCIWLPDDCSFKHLLLSEFHATPLGGHMGVKKTLARLQENFYWTTMLTDVTDFIKQCLICQQVKYVTKKPRGLLQPIPLPHRIWEGLSMDFVCVANQTPKATQSFWWL